MKSFFLSLFSSDEKSPSIKRFIGFLGFLAIAITMFANSFSHQEIGPKDNLVDAITMVTIMALFGTSLDKFTGLSKNSKTTRKTRQEYED
jgi:hypothetical protein